MLVKFAVYLTDRTLPHTGRMRAQSIGHAGRLLLEKYTALRLPVDNITTCTNDTVLPEYDHRIQNGKRTAVLVHEADEKPSELAR